MALTIFSFINYCHWLQVNPFGQEQNEFCGQIHSDLYFICSPTLPEMHCSPQWEAYNTAQSALPVVLRAAFKRVNYPEFIQVSLDSYISRF